MSKIYIYYWNSKFVECFCFFRGSVKNKMYNRNIVVFHSMYTKHALEDISGPPPAEYSVRSPVLDRRSWRHVPASRSNGLNGFWELIHEESMLPIIFFSDRGESSISSIPPPPYSPPFFGPFFIFIFYAKCIEKKHWIFHQKKEINFNLIGNQ